jgi:hypothetical protein
MIPIPRFIIFPRQPMDPKQGQRNTETPHGPGFEPLILGFEWSKIKEALVR